jgi:uracil-DNA glycosylase
MNATTIPKMFAGLEPKTLQWLKHDNEVLMKTVLKAINADINNDANSLCPEPANILNAFRLCPLEEIKVVILGQDPYPNKKNAMGLSFSIPVSQKPIPPSLINIYKCLLEQKLVNSAPTHGDLTSWAKQGILLLNSALTTRVGVSNAHQNIWKPYVDQILSDLNVRESPIIFVLWGGDAIKKKSLLKNNIHAVLTWGHPSPISPYNKTDNPKNFIHCDNFVSINKIYPINWDSINVAPTIPVAIAVADKPADDQPAMKKSRAGCKWTVEEWTKLGEMLSAKETSSKIAEDMLRSATSIQSAIPRLVEMEVKKTGKSVEEILNILCITDPELRSRIQNGAEVISADKIKATKAVVVGDIIKLSVNDTVYVSTDGACKANGKSNAIASWAYYIESKSATHRDKGLINAEDITATNNRGELMAFLKLAEYLMRYEEKLNIEWIYDSEYACKCLMEYAPKWITDRRKQMGKKNLDLILPGLLMMKELNEKHTIKFIHIHSHTDKPSEDSPQYIYWRLNDIVDKLCTNLLA